MKTVIIRSGWLKQKWHFRIVASNGKILAVSEKYNNLVDVEATLATIKREIGNAPTVWPTKDAGIHPDPPPHKP